MARSIVQPNDGKGASARPRRSGPERSISDLGLDPVRCNLPAGVHIQGGVSLTDQQIDEQMTHLFKDESLCAAYREADKET